MSTITSAKERPLSWILSQDFSNEVTKNTDHLILTHMGETRHTLWMRIHPFSQGHVVPGEKLKLFKEITFAFLII